MQLRSGGARHRRRQHGGGTGQLRAGRQREAMVTAKAAGMDLNTTWAEQRRERLTEIVRRYPPSSIAKRCAIASTGYLSSAHRIPPASLHPGRLLLSRVENCRQGSLQTPGMIKVATDVGNVTEDGLTYPVPADRFQTIKERRLCRGRHHPAIEVDAAYVSLLCARDALHGRPAGGVDRAPVGKTQDSDDPRDILLHAPPIRV